MTNWIIEVAVDGKVDVTRDRKAFAYDLYDIDEARHRIKKDKHYQSGDKVEVVEPDGYRHRISSL